MRDLAGDLRVLDAMVAEMKSPVGCDLILRIDRRALGEYDDGNVIDVGVGANVLAVLVPKGDGETRARPGDFVLADAHVLGFPHCFHA